MKKQTRVIGVFYSNKELKATVKSAPLLNR